MLKKLLKRSVAIAVIIMLAFGAGILTNPKNKSKDASTKEEVVNNEQELNSELDMQKKIYSENLERSTRFRTKLQNEIKIILMQESGCMQVSHKKSYGKDKFSKWLFESNVALLVNYTASIGINSDNLKFDVKEDGLPKVEYSKQDIYVISVEIDKIISEANKGILAKEYTPSEISALTLVVKDRIREEVQNDKAINLLTCQKLESYLSLEALKMQIFEIEVIGY